ncbi:hypothetical protein TOPH_08325 [Tolypocladium ophioglossoides CBS 100239]|uniref:Aminoglycoside phosphotransferase domain-containing protein n=1 Tax=Tolypocladium ophioglossoides (strain CBS 100239) TaxID=1163406 RepID=A0A0L0MYY4_TOLOC|nr:hypothetical protein TOPH_08325 [Tolypocladium ophioglossoides CBS 100239]
MLQRPSRLTFEGPDSVRKRGRSFQLRREVEAMNFVQRNTSIPIPTVLEVHFDDRSYVGSFCNECQDSNLPDTYDIRFTHADLSWENILVDVRTGKVNAILDWEMAGFWPEWWEYRKAVFGCRSQPWWTELLKKVIIGYVRETNIDMDLEMF